MDNIMLINEINTMKRCVGTRGSEPNTHNIDLKELNVELNTGLVLNSISGSESVGVSVIGQLVKVRKFFKKASKLKSKRVSFNSYYDNYSSTRSVGNLKDIIKGYFSKPNIKFITLTYDPKLKNNQNKIFDISESHKKVKLFIRKLQIRYPNFKYVCVAERHLSGAIHYHLLALIPYI